MMIPRGEHKVRCKWYAPGLLTLAFLISPYLYANTEPATLSASAEKCLTCHSLPGLSKTLQDGAKLSLFIPRDEFSESVHGVMGCRGCHSDVNPDQHPAMRSIASASEFAVEASAVCQNCHAAKFEQYQGSIHANLVAAGDESAPVCGSCHNPHEIQRVATFQPASGEPCKACHEDIFDAYAGSVHGKALVEKELAVAPFCTDCHQAHEVSAVAVGDQLKQACLSCHENALQAHDQWLPNSSRHLDSVSCPACHSPMAERTVDLRLYDSETQEPVAADPGFEARVAEIDVAGDGLDPLELWKLVRETGREHADSSLTLRGRLEVGSGVQAHQLAFKQEAVRNCNTCHESGADVYDQVTVSVSDSEGRRIRYQADEETLTSAVSVDTVGGFYTAGGTRIKLLDVLLVLGIMVGLGIPAIHWTLRMLARKKG